MKLSELMEKLRVVGVECGDIEVFVDDADTSWLLPVKGVNVDNGRACIEGTYEGHSKS